MYQINCLQPLTFKLFSIIILQRSASEEISNCAQIQQYQILHVKIIMQLKYYASNSLKIKWTAFYMFISPNELWINIFELSIAAVSWLSWEINL